MLIFEIPVATKYTVEGHIDYHQQIINYVLDYGNILLAPYPALAEAREALITLVKTENDLHHFSQKDYTKAVSDRLEVMDNKLSVVRSFLEILLRNPAKQTAATHIKNALKLYGDIAKKPVDKQDATMLDFCARCYPGGDLNADTVTCNLEQQIDELGTARGDLATARDQKNRHQQVRPEGDMTQTRRDTDNRRAEIFHLVESIVATATEAAEKSAATKIISYTNVLTVAKNSEYRPKVKKVNLDSPTVSVEITTPTPVIASADVKAFVQITVRYATGDPKLGTVTLEEGLDYFKRYENNISPNPNAKVIVKGMGRYVGENEARFEIKLPSPA
ncbi:MAG: DUF6261 family protein [Prevotellaceae bacterium]|jgi:hypothetical protein|nr:DUF6261 family protein [Prevotellaceae bacterium]